MSRAVRASISPMNLQRDVVVLGLEPSRADNSAAQKRELADDHLRQFEAREQARHRRGFPSRARRLPQIPVRYEQAGAPARAANQAPEKKQRPRSLQSQLKQASDNSRRYCVIIGIITHCRRRPFIGVISYII